MEVADVERVSREIHILKLIRHPNIVQLYEIIETTKYLFLVMEFVMRGELFDYIVERKKYTNLYAGWKKRKRVGCSNSSSQESNTSISSISCTET